MLSTHDTSANFYVIFAFNK